MSATTQTSDQAIIDELLAAEAQRCRGISTQDREALSAVLSDDLMYRHSTGLVEGKEDYIETSIGGTPRTLERRELDVRIIGEARDGAVVIGDYLVKVEPDERSATGHTLDAVGLQIWVKNAGQWQLLAHHGTVND